MQSDGAIFHWDGYLGAVCSGSLSPSSLALAVKRVLVVLCCSDVPFGMTSAQHIFGLLSHCNPCSDNCLLPGAQLGAKVGSWWVMVLPFIVQSDSISLICLKIFFSSYLFRNNIPVMLF